MKKFLSIIMIFILFLIAYFLQANFFEWFTIAGIKPNLLIILALFIGLVSGKIYGGIAGVIMGFLIDFFVGTRIRNKCHLYRTSWLLWRDV